LPAIEEPISTSRSPAGRSQYHARTGILCAMSVGRPETRYVAVGDADVAFQVSGDGPFDLLCFYGLGSQIDLLWDLPPAPAELFSAFARTIEFDRRGNGASDALPHGGLPQWEDWADDVSAVLDAAESDRAVLYAETDAGPVALLFAAMHPERVSGLVLVNTTARYSIAEDYPIGIAREVLDAWLGWVARSWGTEQFVRALFPSVNDAESSRLHARMHRAAATPRTASEQFRYIFEKVDARHVLPSIRVPTLVVHNVANRYIPIEHGRYLAGHIAGAKLVEIASEGDVNIAGETIRTVVEEVVEFVTGERPLVEVDRVLTTVLFTDIVGSSELVAALGDRRWRSLLDAHDRAVREQLRRYRGREINTTGDGFFASFDGPARAIRCARDIIDAGVGVGVDVRAGLHTGECEIRDEDLSGFAVHVAARIGALAGPRELLVTGTVRDLVAGSKIQFDDRGAHSLKGIPDEWRILAVTNA